VQFVYIFGLFVFFVLVLIDEPKNAILAALLNHQLLNTSEMVVISMIRLFREVDYNESDKTFRFDYNVSNTYYNKINYLKLNKYGYIRA
jgi:hypothetical protein